MHPQEYQFIFGPCEEYPTFESINRLDNNNNNINYNNNPNNINNNNIDMNFNLNNYQNQKNTSVDSTAQTPPATNNFKLLFFEFVLGLES